ncbi:MAG: LLM class flavin-dependent oxidoreductase [Gammaproteobacteria bacterium]|nr:LLM class flavin-dependent oxidoreductase [Gammaproteobacteria bacterium]
MQPKTSIRDNKNMTIEFGIFDHLDIRTESLNKTYAERIRVAQAAEAAGFRGYHLAEHHGTPLGAAPSPGIFLAALAQATSRIRIGPLVYLVPLYIPLRLIEEICMLDHLSNGRLEIGLGRGVSPIEVAFFGVEPDAAIEMFIEGVDLIIEGLNCSRLTFKGKHYQYEDVPMVLQTVQSPLPLWSASMSPGGQAEAAKRGMHTISLGSTDLIRQTSENYRAEWRASQDDPLRPEGGPEQPFVGAWRMIYVNEDEDRAESVARRAYDDWFAKLHKLWVENNVEAPHLGPISRFETAEEIGMIVHGSAARVADALARQVEITGVNYLALQPAFGDIGHDEELRSLGRFAEHVMPQLKNI